MLAGVWLSWNTGADEASLPKTLVFLLLVGLLQDVCALGDLWYCHCSRKERWGPSLLVMIGCLGCEVRAQCSHRFFKCVSNTPAAVTYAKIAIKVGAAMCTSHFLVNRPKLSTLQAGFRSTLQTFVVYRLWHHLCRNCAKILPLAFCERALWWRGAFVRCAPT